MCQYLLLIILYFASSLFAEGLPGERIVQFGEGKQQQTFKELRIADLDSLHTKVIYSRKGLVYEGSKGLVLIFPGTSGRVDSEYGIERSLAPIANEMVKRGYSVIAFQPPIYFKADAPELRDPYLQTYGKLVPNLNWYTRAIHYAETQIPAKLAANPNFNLYSVNRSTFAAVALEALHRYAKNDVTMAAMGKLKGIVAMGLDGHTPEEIAAWFAAESDFFLVKHKEKGDPDVVKAAPGIFSAMSHQTELVAARAGLRLPYVIGTVGSRDELCNGKISNLLPPALRFSKFHPDISFTLGWHDGFHDPGREIPELGKGVAGPLSRMRLILDRLFAGEAPKPGLEIAFLPNKTLVSAPLSPLELGLCQASLFTLGGVNIEFPGLIH